MGTAPNQLSDRPFSWARYTRLVRRCNFCVHLPLDLPVDMCAFHYQAGESAAGSHGKSQSHVIGLRLTEHLGSGILARARNVNLSPSSLTHDVIVQKKSTQTT